jgi:membrane protease YdiL (CAAX protease family)
VQNRPLRQAVSFYVWLVLVAAVFDLGLYELQARGWGQVGLQIVAYALLVTPVVVWSPRTFCTLRMPRAQAWAGAVLVAAAVAGAALVRHHSAIVVAETVVKLAATAVGEEIAFRGFIWERTHSAGLGPFWLVATNSLAFAVWHLVAVRPERCSCRA